MAFQLPSVTVVIIIGGGVLTFIILFIFAKRQIMRFALRSKRGPHLPIGHDAKKALRKEIERRIEVIPRIVFEPQLLVEQDKYFIERGGDKPSHYYRFKAVDDVKTLEAEIVRCGNTYKRHTSESLRAYLLTSFADPLDSGGLKLVHQFCDMYEHARHDPADFNEDDYNNFYRLYQKLRDAARLLQTVPSNKSSPKKTPVRKQTPASRNLLDPVRLRTTNTLSVSSKLGVTGLHYTTLQKSKESKSDQKKEPIQATSDWTRNNEENSNKSIAEQVKEVAESALQQTGMVYVESAGMYYDYKSGYYYNPQSGLYYHSSTGCYYCYSEDTHEFVFHSYAEGYQAQEVTKKRKHKKDEKEGRSKNKKSKKPVEVNLEKVDCSRESVHKKQNIDLDNKKDVSEKDIKSAEKTNNADKLLETPNQKPAAENNDSENLIKAADIAEENNTQKGEGNDEKIFHSSKDELESADEDTYLVKTEPLPADQHKDVKLDEINTDIEQSTLTTESMEEGECSSSELEESNESSSDESSEADEFSSADQASCIRIMVKETKIPKLKVGSLFLVTKIGGTLGREGEQHTVMLKDENVSKIHLEFKYDEASKTYTVADLGSRNGTFLNGKRLSGSKEVSEPEQVVHGSILQLGETKLLCHIHKGRETCGHCEPGLIMKEEEIKERVAFRPKCLKEQHRLELARLKNVYATKKIKAIEPSPTQYEDKAEARRRTVGSDHHSFKTQQSDLNTEIDSTNKGFKMLSKMGWAKGEGLGKAASGETAPVPLVGNASTAGLGSGGVTRIVSAPADMKLSRPKLRKPAKAFLDPLEDDD